MTKKKVAIIGGGLGGVGAALALSSSPELRSKFDVTLYSQGWRLGGKGASGRNQEQGDRIEEHGLHVFLGFYDTAFSVMQETYAEWQKPADYAFQTWKEAFDPQYSMTLMEKFPTLLGDRWEPWIFNLPKTPGEPGDPTTIDANIYIPRIVEHIVGRLMPELREHEALATLANLSGFDKLDAILDLLAVFDALDPGAIDKLVALLEEILDWFQTHVEPIATKFTAGWKLSCLVDFGLTFVIGLLKDVVPYGQLGFDRINDQDFKDWLAANGLGETFHFSAPVRSLYDLTFAYILGKTKHEERTASMSAGAAANVMILLFFGYKDAPIWKMRAGMGDTVFTPIYETLKQRGVTVELFHRFQSLEVAPDGTSVQSLRLWRQVDLKAGTYDPLISVPYGDNNQFLYCWPSAPLWDQVVGGEETAAVAGNLESISSDYHVGTLTLSAGEDFDAVVMAIPPASQARYASDLALNNARYAEMLESSSAVPTGNVQLWFKPDLEGLGWTEGPTVAVSNVQPLDSWGEMSQTLPAEPWQGYNIKPQAVEYLCGPMPFFEEDEEAMIANSDQFPLRLREISMKWLDNNGKVLWPNVVHKHNFDNLSLVSAYYRYNWDPTELYVQSRPGTIAKRLKPSESGFNNMFLAGDWTRTLYSMGSAESAIASGLDAGAAIAVHFKT
ncbi:FAD-dependent oxidoreductase [Kordiimonas sp.]|uniref:FAD-dependent oxidoreductase n=1 Tax=Kordiimonas sp. TaxID=1970157 RepID=UPI003A95AD9B